MLGQYEKKEISLEKLVINPNNARFYDQETKSKDEVLGINSIINLRKDHVINLCRDISQNGLLPTELPIVMALEDNEGYFMVYDGNRRLTSLKLITTYKNKWDKFNLTENDKEQLNQLSSDITEIECIVSNDLAYVNKKLAQIHSDGDPGTKQINWSPQAKSKHNKDAYGEISTDLAFAYLLEYLTRDKNDSHSAKVIKTINEGQWNAKMKRFLNRKEIMLLLGVEFDSDNKIISYFSENILDKIITSFFMLVDEKPASEIAQKVSLQDDFVYSYIFDKNIAEYALSNTKIIFDPYINELAHSKELVERAKYKANYDTFISKMTVSDTDRVTNNAASKSEGISPQRNISTTETSGEKEKSISVNQVKNISTNVNIKSQKPKTRSPKKNKFCRNLKYAYVNTDDNENIPLINICEEIIRFSKGSGGSYPYKKYPIAATVLLRSLVEQSLKYLLRNAMPQSYGRISRNGNDPLLSKLINTINPKEKDLFKDEKVRREYNALFTKDGFKDALDLSVHHSRRDPTIIEMNAENFLIVANYILNTDLKHIEN
ncbi:hypothetical protein [Pectinatus frisingensis]|uniref:hypothetical protein n=1 Tax=Pectinatus frisingensis TaxID=865 RepID=UPI0018C84D75|nr:hypothetical protein [Pectinatus frisingensis]